MSRSWWHQQHRKRKVSRKVSECVWSAVCASPALSSTSACYFCCCCCCLSVWGHTELFLFTSALFLLSLVFALAFSLFLLLPCPKVVCHLLVAGGVNQLAIFVRWWSWVWVCVFGGQWLPSSSFSSKSCCCCGSLEGSSCVHCERVFSFRPPTTTDRWKRAGREEREELQTEWAELLLPRTLAPFWLLLLYQKKCAADHERVRVDTTSTSISSNGHHH